MCSDVRGSYLLRTDAQVYVTQLGVRLLDNLPDVKPQSIRPDGEATTAPNGSASEIRSTPRLNEADFSCVIDLIQRRTDHLTGRIFSDWLQPFAIENWRRCLAS